MTIETKLLQDISDSLKRIEVLLAPDPKPVEQAAVPRPTLTLKGKGS